MRRPESPHAYTRMVTRPAKGLERRRISPTTGDSLRAARVGAELTQEQLAARTADVARQWQKDRSRRRRVEASGLSRSTISRLETGSRAPSIRTARLLIEALGLRRRDPLRKALIAEVSPSKQPTRRLRGAVRRSTALRLGIRALSATAHRPTSKIQASEAKRLRQIGRRFQKGGMPKRRARRVGAR
jgi:DNA-binding XRE family transcriptional regulator